MWQGCREKGTFDHWWWECKLVYYGKQKRGFLKKLKLELPYDLAIPLLDICPKEMKLLFQRDICTLMFIAVLFAIAKVWKQAKYLSVGEWIKKVVCEGTYVYLWLIHVDVWQKPTQFCKAIILQLKNKFKIKKQK